MSAWRVECREWISFRIFKTKFDCKSETACHNLVSSIRPKHSKSQYVTLHHIFLKIERALAEIFTAATQVAASIPRAALLIHS